MEVTPVNIIYASLLESLLSFYFIPHLFPVPNLTSIFLIFSLVNCGAYVLHVLVIYPFFTSPLRNLPTPRSGFIPIVGHGHSLFKKPIGSAHLQMMRDTPNDGIIYIKGFFHESRLLLTSPAALAEVLVHKSYDFEKPPWVRTFLRQFLGDGLLMTEGDEHRMQRKQIMPAFSFRHIKELYPVFWSKSVELGSVVKSHLVGKSDPVLDITHFSTQVTLDIIGLAGLGRDIDSLRSADDELVKNYEEILEPTTEKGFYFLLHLVFPPWFIKALPWGLNKRVRITTGNLARICREFVVEKRASMDKKDDESKDILSIMIKSGQFSDRGLVDQLLTFLAAGHETTSSALTWATNLLAVNPAMQSTLRAEIHKYIPDPKAVSDPTFDIATVLESMPYLNAVCNETLRLYPTIPSTARIAVRNTSINGQLIPKGTLFFIVPWATNRNPELWGPDAEQFKPERWIDSETGKATNMGGAESNYSFLTFLHGPRSCIGERFARAEMRALVAAFVGNFEVTLADPNEEIIIGGTITSKPVNGMRLRLKAVGW